jgi:predicted phosphodiesterase
VRVLRASAALVIAIVVVLARSPQAQDLALPLKQDSVKFAVIGDTGTGDSQQYDIGKQMAGYHDKFPFTFVLMLGDNIYGSERPQDFEKKFEKPYKAMLDAKVDFFAALGNHDDPNQRYYKPFGMNGQRYYTFKKGNARFFALDSNYMSPEQLAWLEKELAASGSDWKIPYFHHPLYSNGMHGSQVDLRTVLEPLFQKYGVNVVFAGHEHFYERIKPQKDIYYFIEGSGGQLRKGDINRDALTEVAFDTDWTFMMVEIADKEMHFQTVSRGGKTVDKGMLSKQEPARTAVPSVRRPQGQQHPNQ